MNDPLNAFVRQDITLNPTGEGCLNDLTFAVKDVFAIEGYISGAFCHCRSEAGYEAVEMD